jgi:hypothetical protein
MNIKNILLVVIIIVLLYIVISYIMKDVNTLTGLMDAKTMQTITPSKLDTNNTSSNTSNFCYSIWIFIENWNYKYGEKKVIFGRMSGDKGACPIVSLGETQNNLNVSLQVYPGTNKDSTDVSSTPTYTVGNIPLQKWVNLTLSAYGRSLDIYIDGKLVRTCLLPGVAKIDATSNVYVTPNGGFSGWTSTFQYWANSCDPQKAWNIYKKGYGGSMLGNFGKYSVKVSLMEGPSEEASVEF